MFCVRASGVFRVPAYIIVIVVVLSSIVTMTSDRTATGSTTVIKTLIIFAALLTCRCLTPPAAHGRLFPTGVQYEYEFRTTVFTDGSSGHVGARGKDPIGHRMVGRLMVANLWSAATNLSASDEKLLRMHVSYQCVGKKKEIQ